MAKKPNPHKGQKFDVISAQWMPSAQWKELNKKRKVITRLEYLKSKPYSKWTKADKAFGAKYQPKDVRAIKKSVKVKESKGLKAQGFTRVNATTAKAIITLREKYPEIVMLSPEAQQRFEYSMELIKHARKRKGFKETVRILIKKAINKESSVEKGEWITADEDEYVNDCLEEWNIPESEYTAVYGSDVI